tara:strand:+ start:2545 stop:3786 length:1242 start_codon:yes stop_codon:yes gene_type:complete
MKKTLKIKKIYYLIFLSLIVRLFSSHFYSDDVLKNEWAMILHNYEVSGTFGINVLINEYLAIPKYAEIGERVLPTVFMPPLYLYFIYLSKLLTNNFFDLTSFIIFLQIFLSLISIILFYKIIKIYISHKITVWFTTSIFAFFPLNIYATSQISSITLQVFLTLLFFYILSLIIKKNNFLSVIFFSIVSGLLILIRGEFFLFYFLTIFYFFLYLNKNFKFFLISLLVTLLTISPYLYRNYQHFSTLTITKSLGYNLLKGNNPSLKIEGDLKFIENIMKSKKKNIKIDDSYDIKLDSLYKEKAFYFIKSEPFEYFKLYILKIISFLLFDFNSTYTHYFNFFHIFPKIFIGITSLIGGIFAFKKRGFFQFLSIYYFLTILLFSVFFIVPRYSLMLLPIQILLSIEVFQYLRRKLLN